MRINLESTDYFVYGFRRCHNFVYRVIPRKKKSRRRKKKKYHNKLAEAIQNMPFGPILASLTKLFIKNIKAELVLEYLLCDYSIVGLL